MGEVFLPGNHRYFGKQFMMWRQEAEMSREEVAEAVGYSAEMVRSVEQGRRACPPRMAEIADELFGARGKLKAGLSYLTREKFPERSKEFFEFEGEALTLWGYQPLLIPGLLQTEAYARTLIAGNQPPLDDETIDKRLAARLERQQLLTRQPPVQCNFVLYEAALRCPMGGPRAYKEQLVHLLEVGKLRNVSIQVLPFEKGFPDALSGSLVFLETRRHQRFVLAEGQSISHFTGDPEQVAIAMQRHGMVRMEALGIEESTLFIERIVREL
ncbi:helix-turn-helix transcriptional regulator [Streptomyces sp. VNUA116]|uniref:helix-turn-helix domain-containing protein n=1 Tax=Streptomyces sp. VNUA116 TaxID=3062449 RepID=UPI002675EECD|nr:helix-turn-helix transcriptional regulator [Streptomyces sp. VNUA116]WKU45725.1 helix-turn-helix transcriptional regulator [Streptomyces sp. VNUA116]